MFTYRFVGLSDVSQPKPTLKLGLNWPETQGKFTTYFTRGLAGDSRLTLDYCAELVTNAFRLTPSARKNGSGSLLAEGSKACLVHFNGPAKHFWRGKHGA